MSLCGGYEIADSTAMRVQYAVRVPETPGGVSSWTLFASGQAATRDHCANEYTYDVSTLLQN